MAETQDTGRVDTTGPLRILHVMRAPVGGLFRHVVDLSRAQAEAGHHVGIVADGSTGGDRARATLDDLAPLLTYGVTRFEMHRLPHPTDIAIAWRIARLIAQIAPHVVHGHGAKGGLYARLPAFLPGFAAGPRCVRIYTPHGGSLHYAPDRISNRIVLFAERALEQVTDFIPFESDFARRRFVEVVGLRHAQAAVVPNGLGPAEFEPLEADADAADFLYIGELRAFKGVDTLLSALALIDAQSAHAPRLTLVGSGPDEAALRALAAQFRPAGRVSFHPPMPAREALRLGRVVVAPSRAESLPYLVLEAIAARLPVVATHVGGVPEIFGARADMLPPCDDPPALARAMRAAMELAPDDRAALTEALANDVRERFDLSKMAATVTDGYRAALARLPRA